MDTLTFLWSGLLLNHRKKQIIDSLLNPDESHIYYTEYKIMNIYLKILSESSTETSKACKMNPVTGFLD